MIDIDKKKYKTENFYKSKYDKTQIILAGSLRKKNYHISRIKYKLGGNSKEWPTYTIDRKGEIFQHFDPKYYSDFMKNKEIDKKSISIVLENMGMLYYDHNTDSYMNWCYDKCDESSVFYRKWNGHAYWEAYTDEQFDSIVELCNYLIEEFDIERNCLGFNVYYDATEKFEGIVTRSNYNEDYSDLNPSFNFKNFLDKLEIEI